jgi:hypothetical protein
MSGHYNGWIGVDLDGTLAIYNGWRGPDVIGEPIPDMVERVKGWLAEGRAVRILTARVWAPNDDADRQRDAALALLCIQSWCSQHLGQVLPVTCVKDYGMIELWDDRAVQVIPNTGERAIVAAEQGRL